MSRLNEILDNHENLDHLFSILKHYGVNAEYISGALLEKFGQQEEDGSENEAEEGNLSESKALVEDLKLFSARF